MSHEHKFSFHAVLALLPLQPEDWIMNDAGKQLLDAYVSSTHLSGRLRGQHLRSRSLQAARTRHQQRRAVDAIRKRQTRYLGARKRSWSVWP